MVDFRLRDCGVKSQELISDSYPPSHKSVSFWGEGSKYIFKKSNVKFENTENDAVFDEICKKCED